VRLNSPSVMPCRPAFLLRLYHFGDRPILDRAQLLARDRSLRGLVARIEQLARAQEAADVIGAEWWGCARGHGYFVIFTERSRNSLVYVVLTSNCLSMPT
jgi:hypothetical protein